MKKSDPPIVIKEIFNTSGDLVWKALTDLAHMKQWYFENIPAFKPQIGFTTVFEVHNEGRTFSHQWKITEMIPGKKIAYEWSFKEYPGASNSIFEIEEKGKQCLLILTVNVLEDFPEDIPEFKRKSCLGGWNYFLGGNLRSFLEKPSS